MSFLNRNRAVRWCVGVAALALPWLGALAIQTPGPLKQKPISDEDTIRQGIVAWRTPGGKFDSACASCHAPDAFDLAEFGFDDATIRRRALAHVDNENATKIIAFVHAIRRKYNLTPLDAMNDRPLQPGGEVLPGATPEERDLAFGKSLATPLPLIMSGRVDSLQTAKQARDEIMAIDARNLKIGIPFNRWSEDIYHGPEHGTVADWMSDTPCAPDPAKEKEWFALVDQYIANPTDTNLWLVYNAVPTDTKAFTNMPFSNEFSFRKYKSMLIAQHLMREKAMGIHDERKSDPIEFHYLTGDVLPNPFWEVGEYAVLNEGFDSDSQGMPDEVRKSIDPKLPFSAQMTAMKVPWMWMGWLTDQSLQRTPGNQSTHNGRYFTLSLYTDGNYAIHDCFMITRKQLVQSFDPNAVLAGQPQPFVLDYSEFATHRNLIRYEPQDEERQAVFRKMTDNVFRMSLYLLIDDAKRTGVVANKAIAEFQLQSIREYLIYSDPDHKAENVALADHAYDVVESSRDLNVR